MSSASIPMGGGQEAGPDADLRSPRGSDACAWRRAGSRTTGRLEFQLDGDPTNERNMRKTTIEQTNPPKTLGFAEGSQERLYSPRGKTKPLPSANPGYLYTPPDLRMRLPRDFLPTFYQALGSLRSCWRGGICSNPLFDPILSTPKNSLNEQPILPCWLAMLCWVGISQGR